MLSIFSKRTAPDAPPPVTTTSALSETVNYTTRCARLTFRNFEQVCLLVTVGTSHSRHCVNITTTLPPHQSWDVTAARLPQNSVVIDGKYVSVLAPIMVVLPPFSGCIFTLDNIGGSVTVTCPTQELLQDYQNRVFDIRPNNHMNIQWLLTGAAAVVEDGVPLPDTPTTLCG